MLRSRATECLFCRYERYRTATPLSTSTSVNSEVTLYRARLLVVVLCIKRKQRAKYGTRRFAKENKVQKTEHPYPLNFCVHSSECCTMHSFAWRLHLPSHLRGQTTPKLRWLQYVGNHLSWSTLSAARTRSNTIIVAYLNWNPGMYPGCPLTMPVHGTFLSRENSIGCCRTYR